MAASAGTGGLSKKQTNNREEKEHEMRKREKFGGVCEKKREGALLSGVVVLFLCVSVVY
jgi:hypothetical protein